MVDQDRIAKAMERAKKGYHLKDIPFDEDGKEEAVQEKTFDEMFKKIKQKVETDESGKENGVDI